jgi:DDE family transposase
MPTDCFEQLTLWAMGRQEVTVTFDAGRVVTDAGLLSLRAFEKELGILAELAERLPDPRAQDYLTHSREALLTQRVYQILAGYPDGNDAQVLRDDALFQTLVGVSPDAEQPLASGSTLNRFHQAYTRRQAEQPVEERSVLLEQQAALNERIRILNDYLLELFLRTRRQPLHHLVIDLDPTDDPTHGNQTLSLFHGYYDQHQYFPLLVFDGDTGFPLAAWLRPGAVHASCGAVEVLQGIVAQVRRAYPGITILVRGDTGLAVPDMYEFCEAEGLLYAFGYASNDVLKERTDPMLRDLEEYYRWYRHREVAVQRFEVFEDYQAGSWSRPRRIIAKLEINRLGTNRRFLVSNMSGHPQGIYHGFYVQRGDVPEKPIGELKNGLAADRLSAHGFRANAMRLLEHVMAYAIVVLYQEGAASVPEVAKAEVATLRQMLWKVGALVQVSTRRICFRFSETWPYRYLWVRVHQAVMQFAEQLRPRGRAGPATPLPLLL